MGTILRLAVRNLRQHKSKTIIIALFLIFGIAIVILGNSFLESVNRGLEKDFRANYTGDLVLSIMPNKGEPIDIFEVNTTNMTGQIQQIPALPEIERVQKIVEDTEEIEKFTKQISAKVLVAEDGEFDMSAFSENEDLGLMDLPIAMLFAGEKETYWKTFDSINLLEGKVPEDGSDELLIEERVKRNFEKTYKKPLNLGDKILVMGANSDGIIREGTVAGIFRPNNENSAMFQIIYSAPSFARSFANLTYASSFKEELPESVDLNLASMSEEDLFDSMFEDSFDEGDELISSAPADFNEILGNTELRDQLNKTDDGAWNFILAKVKNPSKADSVIACLRQTLSDEGITNVQVMDWKSAAYSYSASVEGIGIIFNILIIILAVVVFIIIMNTMTVSVIERTGEIGTMRAIGAEKKFVQKLFYTESLFLTFVSAVIGIILAFIIMAIFNSFQITITNEIAKMLLGGGLLHFSPTFKIIIVTLIVSLLGSVVSNIYPVNSALKITPLKALSKGSE